MRMRRIAVGVGIATATAGAIACTAFSSGSDDARPPTEAAADAAEAATPSADAADAADAGACRVLAKDDFDEPSPLDGWRTSAEAGTIIVTSMLPADGGMVAATSPPNALLATAAYPSGVVPEGGAWGYAELVLGELPGSIHYALYLPTDGAFIGGGCNFYLDDGTKSVLFYTYLQNGTLYANVSVAGQAQYRDDAGTALVPVRSVTTSSWYDIDFDLAFDGTTASGRVTATPHGGGDGASATLAPVTLPFEAKAVNKTLRCGVSYTVSAAALAVDDLVVCAPPAP